MNATDSSFMVLTDAGCLSGLRRGALGARYRFWRDGNGKRHVFSVYEPGAAPDYPDAVAIVARRTPAGSIAMWVGRSGAEARRMALRLDADEIHVHVLGAESGADLHRLWSGASSTGSGQVAARLPMAPAIPRERRVVAA